MSWLGGNSFFFIILLLCVGMHLFHGHGGHGRHRDDEESGASDDRHKH